MNIFDRALISMLNRPAIKAKFVEHSPPRHIRLEATDGGGTGNYLTNLEELFSDFNEEQMQRIALSISWIYSSLDLLARKILSSGVHVVNAKGEKNLKHPFKKLLDKPNEFMGMTFLLRHLVYSITVSENGAFWYMSPERGNPSNIIEIWPINPVQIEPEKHPSGYVQNFVYRPKNAKRAYKLPAENIIWFRYADIHNYWKSYPPIKAMLDAMAVKMGISDSQKKFYSSGRGLPLSIVSVSPEISEADYLQFRADLNSDWSSDGKTLAIARGGILDVKSLGLTQRDLEILGSQEMARDELDAAILGIAIHGRDIGRGDGLKQADKFVNDNAAYPLHVLIAETLTIQGLYRWWEDGNTSELNVKFDDIRATDRALTVQEATIYSRWKTLNEMRAEQGFPPLEGPNAKYGDYIVPFGTNPSVYAQESGINIHEGQQKKEPGVGNLSESQHPTAVANTLADNEGVGSQEKAFSMARVEELKKWRKVAMKDKERAKEFACEVIPEPTEKFIKAYLERAGEDVDLELVFSVQIDMERERVDKV